MPAEKLVLCNIGIESNNLRKKTKHDRTENRRGRFFTLESRLAYLVKLCPTNFITSGNAVRQ
jgi:hypothetical protein